MRKHRSGRFFGKIRNFFPPLQFHRTNRGSQTRNPAKAINQPTKKNMKNTIYRIALLAGIIAAGTFSASAAPGDGDGEGKGRGQGRGGRPELTEEQKAERKAAMEERRAEWEALSPEEKEARKAEMQKRREAWQKLTPEERKAKMEASRAAMKALVEKYDTDGVKGLSKEERKAMSEDEDFKKLRAEMPMRRPGGRPGGPGGKPGNRGGKPGGKGGKGGGEGAPDA